MLVFLGSAWGQSSTFDNLFFSLGGGVNSHADDNSTLGTDIGYNGKFNVGYHLSNTIALRVGASFMTNTSSQGTPARYYYGSGDLMWNVTNSIFGYTRLRRFGLVGFTGFGIARSSGDNDFMVDLGLQYFYILGSSLSLFAELGAYLMPSNFDQNQKASFTLAATAGLSYLIGGNQTKDVPGVPFAHTDWYVGLGLLGVNSFQFSDLRGFDERLGLLEPNFEFILGKTITKDWSVRFLLSGIQSRYAVDVVKPGDLEPERVKVAFGYFSLEGDIMLDAVRMIAQKKHMSRLSLYPYLGGGILARTDYLEETCFALNSGIFSRVILGERSDLFLDIHYGLVPPSFMHTETTGGRFSTGLLSCTMGYIINLGESRYRKVY